MINILIIIFVAPSAADYAILSQSGTDCNTIYHLSHQGYEDFYKVNANKIIPDPILQIRKEGQHQLDIRIYDQQNQQYQIPLDQEPYQSTFRDIEEPEASESYSFELEVSEDPLKIEVIRSKTGEPIFCGYNLMFSQHYVELDSVVPSPFFFGLGERNQKGFKFKEGYYTLFARDEPKLIEDGRRPGKHVYSSQPVYLMKEQSGYYHVLLYKTASPVDVQYFGETLKFITVGGIVHLKIFLGDTDPRTAIKRYHCYLGGGWALHPFWVHGLHQSRWGYKSSEVLVEVVEEYHKNGIPLDGIWSDLDYMQDRQIFSVNTQLFKHHDLEYIRNQLRVKFVPLLDVAVGVKYGQKDLAYKTGCEMDIFCRSPDTGLRFKGFVWPGESHFPDFHHPNISTYWGRMFAHFSNQLPFDGIWLDMNEPVNFCDGECKWDRTDLCPDHPRTEYLSDPLPSPYMVGSLPFEKKTLSQHLRHYGGAYHKDVHNLYGLLSTYHTYQSMRNLGFKMPFILSRSTFPGSGKYGQHWFGDNAAKWDMMYLSIGQIFQFQVRAVLISQLDLRDPVERGGCVRVHAGHGTQAVQPVDPAGHPVPVLPEPQQRPLQRAGVLRPRRHRPEGGAQEPAPQVLHPEVVLRPVRQAELHRHRYASLFNPLFYIYHDDKEVFRDEVMDTQFIIGDSLMATPILRKDELVRKAYFPQSGWFDFLSGMRIQSPSENSRYHLIYCPYDDYLPLFIRSGAIIAQQNTSNIKTLHDLDDSFTLVIALDSNYRSRGEILDLEDYLDDDQIYSSCVLGYCVVDIQFESLMVNRFRLSFQRVRNKIRLRSLKIYGLDYRAEQGIECRTQEGAEIGCHKKVKGYYSYNTVVYFEDGLVIGDSNECVYIELV